MKEIDHEYTDEIICPHCGHKYSDCWEWGDDEGVEECYNCYKPFSWTRNITVNYCTEKETYQKCERCGENKVLGKVYIQPANTNYKMVCEDCNRYLAIEKHQEK